MQLNIESLSIHTPEFRMQKSLFSYVNRELEGLQTSLSPLFCRGTLAANDELLEIFVS